MDSSSLINIAYIVAAFFFIFGLKQLGHPATARKGNAYSALGMLISIVATLLDRGILSYQWVLIAGLAGIIVGVLAARLVGMTSMPEMVALLNGFGGIASLLVGWGAFARTFNGTSFTKVTIAASCLIGGMTFTGSLIAWAKLKGVMSGKPTLFMGQQFLNTIIMVAALAAGVIFSFQVTPDTYLQLQILMGLSLVFGVLIVIPIGGADMPVVISLLNSFSGVAACFAGFAIFNNLLIVAGSLVGASGIILTNIMCKSMNRTIGNVLFGGFGATTSGGSEVTGEVKPISVPDTHLLLEAATSVLFVPGYGLAVAQAQHTVRELAEHLEDNGCDVRFGIHPVAGRMPGHMNVLLAEASVPYEQLAEMDDVNPTIASVDVCLVIGANDVVNPSAREDESSMIYGMPIINVDLARTVIVLKRSMNPGFAGIQNPLFFKPNTRMLFGDAKSSIQGLVGEFKES